MADNTQYQFEGEVYRKGKLVLNVIRYLVNQEGYSFSALKQDLASIPFHTEMILEKDAYEQRLSRSSDTENRFFTKEPLTDSEDTNFYVSNQWGIAHIDGFVRRVRDFGVTIDIVADLKSDLIQSFQKYKQNPDERYLRWQASYSERCEQLTDVDVTQFDFTDNAFLDKYWREGRNGICSVKPGMLSTEEFASLKNDLPDISQKIAAAPNSSTLQSVMDWAKTAREAGRFQAIKKGVIHRFFCACAPQLYCTIINYQHLLQFIKAWNEKKLGPDIETTGDWAELNSRVVQTVKMRGLENEDVFLVNTFIYRLKEMLLGEIDDQIGSLPIDVPEGDTSLPPVSQKSDAPLNQILYGPPGTGKTYSTVERAVAIVEPEWFESLVNSPKSNDQKRKDIKCRFDQLLEKGGIAFTTFHQSFSYEDFVEGLKAESEGEQINYSVEDGIFKRICQRANSTQKTIGLDAAINDLKDRTSEEPVTLHTVMGNPFALSYRGGKTFGCMPEASASDRDLPANIEHVKRVVVGEIPDNLYCGSYVKAIAQYINDNYEIEAETQASPSHGKSHVLIIDEINRGNIAKIFGELITLLEPDKRKGQSEQLSVVLPYSKETFSIPANLHVIGTMNTADTSLAKVDIALRRRFEFIEEMPNPGLLTKRLVAGVDVSQMLKTINERIELLYDRDHTIGHSYFMGLSAESSVSELASIFSKQIIPLLEEYFFEDWALIHRVLGDHLKGANQPKFIIQKNSEKDMLRLMGPDWQADSSIQMGWKLNASALSDPEAYRGIYAPVSSSNESEVSMMEEVVS